MQFESSSTPPPLPPSSHTAGAGDSDFVFEAIPDAEVTDYSLRLCEVKVHSVGEALPCVRGFENGGAAAYSKSDETIRTFDDFGTLSLGPFCPVNYPDAEEESNQFKATLVYELPPQPDIAANGIYM